MRMSNLSADNNCGCPLGMRELLMIRNADADAVYQ